MSKKFLDLAGLTLYDSKIKTLISEGGGGGGGGADSPYDLIIRTQAEFDAMITDGRTLTNKNIQSSTWKGAKSVALVGTFTLDLEGNQGVKIPTTVTRIDGYNNAKLTVNGFAFNSYYTNGGLWNTRTVSDAKCYISNLSLVCNSSIAFSGFRGKNTVYNNCSCRMEHPEVGGTIFKGDNNYYNACDGIAIGGFDSSVQVFTGNHNVYNTCTAVATGTYGAEGFSGNNNIYANCTGTGTSDYMGYGFYITNSIASNCKNGPTPSTTATWGGSNNHIDPDTCPGYSKVVWEGYEEFFGSNTTLPLSDYIGEGPNDKLYVMNVVNDWYGRRFPVVFRYFATFTSAIYGNSDFSFSVRIDYDGELHIQSVTGTNSDSGFIYSIAEL